MPPWIFDLLFALGWAITNAIRLPSTLRASRNRSVATRTDWLDQLLRLGIVAFTVLPWTALVTDWLASADYALPVVIRWLGVALFAAGLWVLYRAHADLGRGFAHELRVVEQQRLITAGIYAHIRHPIYAALVLIGLGQALLLDNWLAGPAGLVWLALMLPRRIPREEQMLLEHFGDAYRTYCGRTGRLLPRLS
ncbi:MAG: isoprenylcysteine carboxylmethyltransferase family protein [Chloroflexales bacterium]|nr:isoprenylcysteine carboxylmethyltransferase family protein [Chloroflexales bacterium]